MQKIRLIKALNTSEENDTFLRRRKEAGLSESSLGTLISKEPSV